MKHSVASKESQRLEMPVRISEQKWPEGTKPVVSIFCITYNHKKFVRDAIKGFLMQKTTFPVEIFIHDDASTDGTAEIVKEYASKHPKLFWTVLQSQNQWSRSLNRGFFNYLSKQRGKFVALCEGDDYWTCSQKLQQQYKILDAEPETAACFHIAKMKFEDGSQSQTSPPVDKWRDRVLEDIAFTFWLPTCSLMFRKAFLPPTMEWSANLLMGDAPLIAELCAAGAVRFSPEQWAVYRQHHGGMWSAGDWYKKQQALLDLFIAARKRFPKAPLYEMDKEKKRICASLFGHYVEQGNLENAKRCLLKFVTTLPTNGLLPVKQKKNLVRFLLGVCLGSRKSVAPPRIRAQAQNSQLL